MKKNFTSFLSVALVITGLLILGDGLAKRNIAEYNLQFGAAIVLIFFFIYIVIHRALLKIGEKEPKKFVNSFMAMMGFKMLILLSFLLAFVYLRPEQKISFLMLFLASYALHTANEVYWASKFMRTKN